MLKKNIQKPRKINKSCYRLEENLFESSFVFVFDHAKLNVVQRLKGKVYLVKKRTWEKKKIFLKMNKKD